MKITKHTFTRNDSERFAILVSDKELELICEAMDLKETEERKRLMREPNIPIDTYGAFGMVKELARNFHNAFMGNIP